MPGAPAKQADFFRAIAGAVPHDVARLYWYARVTLLGDVADLAAFDRVFEQWFGRGLGAALVVPPPVRDSEVRSPRDGAGRELPASDARPGSGIAASALATAGRRGFGRTDPRQRDLMRLLRDAWPANLPTLPSRRRRPSRSGRELDMRRTWQRARRNDGEIAELRWTTRPRRTRRLLLLVDVSGSLRQHTPELLRLAHAALRGVPERTEVFTFGTRLTRVTGALSGARVDRALHAVSGAVHDADGGTAIGAAMRRFLDNPRYLALARGALVVVISDGLERGDCTAMIRSTERLSRLAYRLIWWSPLACSPTYRPVTRGMAGVLRHLDHLGGVRDLASGLAEVGRIPSVAAGPRRSAHLRRE
ncbi:VWA domain-containing protein [Actinoplanes sp. TBRC 11911]|uniref:VWA domain-containing protein n=1 Tax=Actinoplanes sp. TBRC 11911 TaxID=2729386 RepID=UPI00145DAB0C|nr:VWA domain-containing protein [Actinoplanes sp. TBRC 11911]NMO53800.1 VWA domain-containing protein [Actinoplanes sp. TBRC 11911]